MNSYMQFFGLALVASLAACGDDGGDGSTTPDATATSFDASTSTIDAGVPQQRSVQVTVTGLRGDIGVVLNGGTAQTLSADGSLTLGSVDVGASYAVTIDSKPGIQGCVLSDDTGTIADSDVDVTVSCEVLMFLTMQDGVNGMEWWKSDGTDAGTTMLANIATGTSSSIFEPDYAVLPRDYVVFPANNVNGRQLWRSDGTTAGTTILKIINSTGNANPENFIEFAGEVYFSASNGVDGAELWKTDGTEAGTVMVKNIDGAATNSLNLQFSAVMGSALYFSANNGADGSELWKSDGTEVGTVMVKDINTAGSSSPSSLVVMNNVLYFSADDGDLNGREVWKSDGTEAGTVILKDINPNDADSNPGDLTPVGNVLYISATSPWTFGGLWKSDGTDAGTTEVLSLANGGPANWSNPLVFEGTLYFTAASMADGVELWHTDGTGSGTSILKDIKSPRGAPVEADPRHFSLVPGGFVFTAFDDGSGRELWKSDGTEVGTTVLADINDGMSGSNVLQWGRKSVVFGGFALYFADDGTSSMEPYRVDFSGATQVKEVNPNGSALPDEG